jgi:membrane associated rhomboid family serine protease
MLGLLFCGRVVETIVGMRGMIILYIAGAYAAAAAHYAAAPQDPLPLIGAGGAVSAVIGAYAILLGRNKLRVAGPSRGLWLNALWLAAAWIAIQALTAFAYGVPVTHIPVAAFAGGFLVGLALAKPLLLLRWRGA